MELWGFVGLALAGALLGVTGGGGGILVVPVLVGLFGMPATQATGLSLALVGLAATFGALRMARSGAVDGRAALGLSLSSGLGAMLARMVLLPAAPVEFAPGLTRDRALTLLFALAMLATAVAMLRRRSPAKAESRAAPRGWGVMPILAAGLGIGVFSGLVGAGGGFLIVPTLILGARVDPRRAVGTSLAVIAVTSAAGFAGELFARARLDMGFLLASSMAILGGMLVGLAVSRRLSADSLRPVFGAFVLAVGVAILGVTLRG